LAININDLKGATERSACIGTSEDHNDVETHFYFFQTNYRSLKFENILCAASRVLYSLPD
jgi:hypothetical protein